MKKINNFLWGLALVTVGVIIALNAFDVTDVNVFFDGWWTLFIIIPCAVGIFTEGDKIGNLLGLATGVLLLLCCQDILSFSLVWKLIVPAVIVVIGLKMIFSAVFKNDTVKIIKNSNGSKSSDGKPRSETVVFSASTVNCNGEVFNGANLAAIFGGIEIFLEGSTIENDCVINANAIFGGIDIIVPDNVTVKIKSTSIFGGASNTAPSRTGVPTVFVNATCIFGGIDVKSLTAKQ